MVHGRTQETARDLTPPSCSHPANQGRLRHASCGCHECLLTGAGAIAAPVRPDAGPSTADPRRALAARPPAEAARSVRLHDPAEQFGAAFAYGEGAGLTETLPELIHRANLLPVGLRDAFIDGAAHTWAPPPGVSPEAVGSRIESDVPQPWRRPFHNGVLVSWSIAHDASPDAVVPRALAYEASAGVDVDDGVRVGLQRSLGDDLPAALKVAARYPADMQDALFEELGWRAGDEDSDICVLAAQTPAQRRCVFVHGAARGRTLRTDWTQPDAPVALATKISAQTCGCEDATWRGAAWGIALQWGHRPQRAHTFARRIDGTLAEAGVDRELQSLIGGSRRAPWILPEHTRQPVPDNPR